nr:hypothetical protein [Tanacetum cinerariifolium]
MARLVFCDYHNMIAILEKYEHNHDFHQIVDFVEASHIRIETTNAETKIFATVDGKPRTISKSSIRRNLKLTDEAGISSLPDAELFKNLTLMGQYTRRAKGIAQSTALPTVADKPASPLRDDSQGEALPIVSGLEAGQDRENFIKTYALPHNSTPRVTSLAANEGNKYGGGTAPSGDDATIKRRSLATGEEAGERRSKDTEELVNVLTSLDAANILTSGGVQVVSISPAAEVSTVGIPTGSGMVPTASPIFTTASVVTPYSRHKGKEKMVEEDQKISEQIARDAEIARIRAEEELQGMKEGLDKSNEVIVKHLQEYEQAYVDLSIGENIELINELVKYQDHHTKILKEDLNQLWALVKETLSIRQAKSDKEKKLWVEIDSLLDEFVGELTLLKSIPSGINENNCDPEEEICLIKKLLYDNSSPRIEEDDYDSERDILILEELFSNDSLSLSKNESFYFDIPSSSHPLAKPPDGNSRILNEKSPNLLSYQGHKASHPSTKYPMMIYGKNTPILDVPFLHFYPFDKLKYRGLGQAKRP